MKINNYYNCFTAQEDHINVLKIFLKLDDFIFSTKTLCQMLFQTCLKGFKLKKLVFKPKTAQSVKSGEPDEQ